ncbi:hypothetical protein ABZ128_30790 [Streptomyces sp. NPDC006326]|uniref:hypothetical protein n=1 Tax=Streptomyces sp. NPDC006326 TaxID=3156752 RepID=UPI0033AE7C14
MRARSVVLGLLLALLGIAWAGTHDLLSSLERHGRLTPPDAPAAVATIVSLGTVIGVLVGAILNGMAKLIQARGQKDADMVRARAELLRAEADMVRARHGLPPAPAEAVPPTAGTPDEETPAQGG